MAARRRFSLKDWEKVSRLYERARTLLAPPKVEDIDLDTAVHDCWVCGEYLINVWLELNGQATSADHRQPDQARELKAQGLLTGDYFQSLTNLDRYRKKADYLAYNRLEPSLSYNRPAVSSCFDDITRLFEETKAFLSAEGHL